MPDRVRYNPVESDDPKNESNAGEASYQPGRRAVDVRDGRILDSIGHAYRGGNRIVGVDLVDSGGDRAQRRLQSWVCSNQDREPCLGILVEGNVERREVLLFERALFDIVDNPDSLHGRFGAQS